MEEIRYSGGKEICVALGVTILLALFLFRVEDSYRIGLLLVAGALLLLRPLPFRKWSRLDGCVAALALSDLFPVFMQPVRYLPWTRLFIRSICWQRILSAGGCSPTGVPCRFYVWEACSR